jgi:hypothetical protein
LPRCASGDAYALECGRACCCWRRSSAAAAGTCNGAAGVGTGRERLGAGVEQRGRTATASSQAGCHAAVDVVNDLRRHVGVRLWSTGARRRTPKQLWRQVLTAGSRFCGVHQAAMTCMHIWCSERNRIRWRNTRLVPRSPQTMTLRTETSAPPAALCPATRNPGGNPAASPPAAPACCRARDVHAARQTAGAGAASARIQLAMRNSADFATPTLTGLYQPLNRGAYSCTRGIRCRSLSNALPERGAWA